MSELGEDQVQYITAGPRKCRLRATTCSSIYIWEVKSFKNEIVRVQGQGVPTRVKGVDSKSSEHWMSKDIPAVDKQKLKH